MIGRIRPHCDLHILFILPGGTLDCGTEADPIPHRVEFIVRDVPIDTRRDPFQWGNGLLNFGTQTRVGRVEKTSCVAVGAIATGQTTIATASRAAGMGGRR